MSHYFWLIAFFDVPVFLFCCGVFFKKIKYLNENNKKQYKTGSAMASGTKGKEKR